MEAIEHLAQPVRTLTARYAPATRFVRVEMHDAAGEVDHACYFVDYHQAARPQHRSGLGEGIEIHRQIDLVGLEQGAGAAARDYGFQLSAIRYASSHVFNHAF